MEQSNKKSLCRDTRFPFNKFEDWRLLVVYLGKDLIISILVLLLAFSTLESDLPDRMLYGFLFKVWSFLFSWFLNRILFLQWWSDTSGVSLTISVSEYSCTFCWASISLTFSSSTFSSNGKLFWRTLFPLLQLLVRVLPFSQSAKS